MDTYANLKDILDHAVRGYFAGTQIVLEPDTAAITAAVADDGDYQAIIRQGTVGDSLLRFMLNELCETYEEGAGIGEQAADAIDHLDTAIANLEAARATLSDLLERS